MENKYQRIEGKITGVFEKRISVDGVYVYGVPKDLCIKGNDVAFWVKDSGKYLTYVPDAVVDKQDAEADNLRKYEQVKCGCGRCCPNANRRMMRSVAWKCASEMAQLWRPQTIEDIKKMARVIESDLNFESGD